MEELNFDFIQETRLKLIRLILDLPDEKINQMGEDLFQLMEIAKAQKRQAWN